jgi:hypothetical protein
MRQILWQFVPIENYGEALAELEKIARRTVSGQERADAEKDAALDALKRAERFIVNGTEFGYIRMPDAPDPALDTLPALRRAIAILAAKEKKS